MSYLGLVEEVEGERVEVLVPDLGHSVLQGVQRRGEKAHPVNCEGMWLGGMDDG